MKRIVTYLFFCLSMLGTTYAQSLIINELCASNFSVNNDNYYEFDDWIELKNNDSQPINLDGFYITDDLNHLFKHRLMAVDSELTIPAGGYLILWADKALEQGTNHLYFKLSSEGEKLILLSPTGQFVDSITYGPQYRNISYGRNIENAGNWCYFSSPTPDDPNITKGFKGVLERPAILPASGLFDSAFLVSISNTNEAEIHYTTSNSIPTKDSILYDSSFSINETSVVMAINTKPGWINSDVVSEFYSFKETSSLPVLAVLTDSANLFGSYGIYTHPYSVGPLWERPCQLRFLENNQLRFSVNAGIRIQGASSVDMDKKSFRLFFRDDYGMEQLEYPIFGSGRLSAFSRLVLKAGYDDDLTTETGTLLRDALSAALWEKTGEIPNKSTWASLYLNNKYWGIYNIRETVDEDYIKDRTGFTDFDLIRFKNEGATLEYGTLNSWNSMYSFIQDNDFSDEANYQQIQSMMNMTSFLRLAGFIQCSQYRSWSWGVSAFRENRQGALWNFSIWDTDRGYTELDYDEFTHQMTTFTSLYWANTIPMKLRQSAEFRRQYINSTCDMLNSVFKPEFALHVFDSLYSIILPEINREINRWNSSNDYYETNIESIRDFLRNRPSVLIEQMKSTFSLTDTNTITLDVVGHGKIMINTLNVSEYPWSGQYFSKNAIDLKAIPDPGYHFAGWNEIQQNPISFQTLTLSENKSMTAYFEEGIVSTKTIDKKQLSVFPNPAKDWLSINYESNSFVRICLLNISGEVIRSIDPYDSNGTLRYQIPQELPKGIYFIRLQTNNRTEIQRFVLIK